MRFVTLFKNFVELAGFAGSAAADEQELDAALDDDMVECDQPEPETVSDEEEREVDSDLDSGIA